MFDTNFDSVINYFGLSESVKEASKSYGGKMAVAFVLNRVLSPIRIVICLIAVPRLAPILNPPLERLYRKYFPAKEERKEEEKKQE